MAINKIKTAPTILIEDDYNKNSMPLLLELIDKDMLTYLLCYDQTPTNWYNLFNSKYNVQCLEDFDINIFEKHSSTKFIVVVDSVVQMALNLGWSECIKSIKKLIINPNITQIILVLHKDCLPHSKIWQLHLNHTVSAIVSYIENTKVSIQLKKGGKFIKSEELLNYDNMTNTLKSVPIIKEERKIEEPVKPLPVNLTTFKIEMEQTNKLEKYKLKLPYMSKINDGQGKVYYEPDAVDDWDDEDPDDDLDI